MEDVAIKRDPKDLVLEARLMSSSAEFVAEWLQNPINTKKYEYDAEIELSLLARNDPLINLTIAEFGKNKAALKKVWDITEKSKDKSSPYIKALRLAFLSNQFSHEFLGCNFVEILSEKGFLTFLKKASDEELLMMGKNPRLRFLEKLYERSGIFEGISDALWQKVIEATAENKRISEEFDTSDDDDGYMYFKYTSDCSGAYNLAFTVPANESWAETLSLLLERAKPYLPYQKTEEDISTAIAVWNEKVPDDAGNDGSFHHPPRIVRTALARLYFSYGIKKDARFLLESEDVAVRAAAYECAELTVEQINQSASLDKEFFGCSIVTNIKSSRTKEQRDAIREAISEHADYILGLYDTTCRQLREKSSYYFKDEDENESLDEGSTITSDPNTPKLEYILNTVNKIAEQVKSIYWTVLLLIAAYVFTKF